MLATGQRRQRLGDLAAGTIVTSADAPSVPVAQPVADAESRCRPRSPTSAFDPQTPESLGGPVDAPAPVVEPFPELPEMEAAEPVVEPFPVEPPTPAVEPAPCPAAEQPADGRPRTEARSIRPRLEPSPRRRRSPPRTPGPRPASGCARRGRLRWWRTSRVVESPAAPAEEARSDAGLDHPGPGAGATAPSRRAEAAEDSVKVRSVETVSAIDLVMGEVEEDEAAGSTPTA